jgi:flagellar protein FlgJ
MTNKEFINQIYQAATELRQAGRQINPAIVAAQAALESGFGKSQLARLHNNLFGVKAKKGWAGPTVNLETSEWGGGGFYRTEAGWRVYPDWKSSIADYASIIESLPWYADAAACPDDPACYLDGLLKSGSEPGWATDPKYRDKVWKIASDYGLLATPTPVAGPVPEPASEPEPEPEPAQAPEPALATGGTLELPEYADIYLGEYAVRLPIRRIEIDGKAINAKAVTYTNGKLYIRRY